MSWVLAVSVQSAGLNLFAGNSWSCFYTGYGLVRAVMIPLNNKNNEPKSTKCKNSWRVRWWKSKSGDLISQHHTKKCASLLLPCYFHSILYIHWFSRVFFYYTTIRYDLFWTYISTLGVPLPSPVPTFLKFLLALAQERYCFWQINCGLGWAIKTSSEEDCGYSW